MIGRADAAALLLACVPESELAIAEVDRYVAAHRPLLGVPDSTPLGSYMDALAHHAFQRATGGDTDWFPVLFAAIELTLAEGDDDTRDIVDRGLLRWLFIASGWPPSGHSHPLRDAMAAWLGPVSQRVWDQCAETERRIQASVRGGTSPEGYAIMAPPTERDTA